MSKEEESLRSNQDLNTEDSQLNQIEGKDQFYPPEPPLRPPGPPLYPPGPVNSRSPDPYAQNVRRNWGVCDDLDSSTLWDEMFG
ncbi:hypothetical protein A3F00_03550 [Candidatus Daviesbacteria bacterium RIFCSPHIGHO2_12_FULL_37_11]|uniref:Uncharacterized protein n=1 Tax=Candidatus Daviesbacteria bacterium RIFCSPHIGHO2_12_FULL_37_11 TaxID=1797777 RepID=A0A1F5KCQ2_9BACT|nr:MAG: hypothetical protein A2769_01090 [Candidatus Daviesbacteria bacterium RIFCSPHIGHO2_01_FULL_37_27]OGE38717.1 MAG: hypothetical protein A3F00_03550 [Candidatus Daviesbacteria bacterium RIFCSPHIGHO2_12_FULL_37_11]OGE45807.1 MAG: hypothetical protein A3B39_01090 [Candidatus Daviesbacteria bacterium RIFCSPLOWO2_01_FULL_37_10]